MQKGLTWDMISWRPSSAVSLTVSWWCQEEESFHCWVSPWQRHVPAVLLPCRWAGAWFCQCCSGGSGQPCTWHWPACPYAWCCWRWHSSFWLMVWQPTRLSLTRSDMGSGGSCRGLWVMKTASVFPSLSISLLVPIHAAISAIQTSTRFTALSTLSGSKEM